MRFPKETFKFVLLAALAIGAGPASAAFWQWSKTASNNAGADPSINWAEGMSPSSVNDSARAMMARAAEYRDDISGLLATAGTSTAYTVTTNQTLCQAPSSTTTPVDGQLLTITMNVTNGAAPTLTADGCNAFPIQSSPAVAVPGASLVLGSPYSMRFSVANSAWMLQGFYGTSLSVPLGGLIPYTLSTVPNSNFVFPAGQCLSTSTYAAYWTALGSPASGSCSGGQFQIIDLSGRVPVGLDTMPGFSAKNRLTSSSTGCGTAMTSVGASCANGLESYALTGPMLPANITNTLSAAFTPNGGATTYFLSTTNAVNTNVVGGVSGSVPVNSYAAVTLGGSIAISGSINPGGGGNHPVVPPNLGVTYLLRVL